MSDIEINIVHVQSVKHNKEYKDLTHKLEDVKLKIYELEIEQSRLSKLRYKIEKQLEELEQKVIESLL